MGRLTYFVVDADPGPVRGPDLVAADARVEAWNIGAGSLFIVLLISAFAGAVTALQTGYQFTGSIPYYVVGTLVVSSIILELGPVLTALILAGRIGARYAAELGTMRVTEQIDALESLGRSPASHLVIPRVLAGLIMIPALTVLANLSGDRSSGWISVKAVLPVTDADFIYGAQYYWRPWDAYYSVIKAFFFAGSITIISCYMGFNTQQGAEGRGQVHHDRGGDQLGAHPRARHRPHPAPAQSMIELTASTSAFGKQVVLDGVDFEVREGETVALLGPSGTGKSVLLKTHHRPDQARQRHGHRGRQGRRAAQAKGAVGAALPHRVRLPERRAVRLDERVRERPPGHHRRGQVSTTWSTAGQRIAECIRLVNLPPETIEKYPAQLSGGMRKRVGIARAIAGSPKYLLYDEPTSGLDPVNADIIDGLVQRLDNELGVTSVMVTHDVRGAFRVADRLALLSEGRIVMQGTPQEFLDSTNPKVREFLERDFDNPSFAA